MSKIDMLRRAQSLADEMIRLRRDIHQHPELSFQEFRTAALVADVLTEIGYEVETGVGRTGVVGRLGSGEGPIIALRADMDALPIMEQNDVPYRSRNAGVMHACGHDAHTAILLGAAHLLRESYEQETWKGSVRLLFQPSEEAFDEQGISGATAMIEDRALDNIDQVIALHVWSSHKSGSIYLQDGCSLAAVDSFDAEILADGGHGAYPHEGADPISMLPMVLNALYAIPSRRIDPLENCVVSIGQVAGGHAHNVIPSKIHLKGTLRSYNSRVRKQLQREVERALKLAETMGGSYRLAITKGYPPLVNDPAINAKIRDVARDFAGDESVGEAKFGMGAEDFAYMADKVSGAMFMLGAAKDDANPGHHHTDTFDIDESVLPLGAAILAETARRFVL